VAELQEEIEKNHENRRCFA